MPTVARFARARSGCHSFTSCDARKSLPAHAHTMSALLLKMNTQRIHRSHNRAKRQMAENKASNFFISNERFLGTEQYIGRIAILECIRLCGDGKS